VTDPFASLYEPVTPVDPAPEFAARLRRELTQEVFAGGTMPVPTRVESSLVPYIVVSDARAAMAWYAEVFGAEPDGDPIVNDDGTIGHAQVRVGGAVLMLSEPSDLWPEVPVRAPDAPTTFSHSLHLEVDDVDRTVTTARRHAAAVEREPGDQPYGRAAVIVDPFGHRWILLRPRAEQP
jgi:uncharacterized glyoxalase superfamily protein PhnB